MDRLVVITGLSGSGKSLAARCLEDVGYFCVDNIPVALIPPFVELFQRGGTPNRLAAVVVDVREREFLSQFPQILGDLRVKGVPVHLVFFECGDEILKRRFSETRRPHPMLGGTGTLEQAIVLEREALAPLRDIADRIIDTSRFSSHELRTFLKAAFGPAVAAQKLNVHIVSFGFKHGTPTEADLLFDVRFLPNPFFVDELRALDGRSAAVRAFLDERTETGLFLEKLRDLLDFLLPRYGSEGKSYLTIAIGCTGGKHRSVALAEDLRAYLDGKGVAVSVTHRDLGKE